MARVLMVLDNAFHPDVRVYNEARSLAACGHEVVVLALDKKNEFADRPCEPVDGFLVQRIFCRTEKTTRRIERGGVWGRLKYAIYAWWYVKFVKQVRDYVKVHPCDYLHCHDLADAFAGSLCTSLGPKMVFDMHELYMEKCSDRSRKLVWKLLLHLYKASYRIVYAGENQLAYVPERFSDRLAYVPNYPLLSMFEGVSHECGKTLRVNYIGAVRGQVRVFKALFEAASTLEDVTVKIHGAGSDYVELKELSKGYGNVEVTGKFDGVKESNRLYSETDVLYCAYDYAVEPAIATTYPVKFYEAIASRTPFVAPLDSCMAKFALQERVGFEVDMTDVEAIRSLLVRIKENRSQLDGMRERLAAMRDAYSWEGVTPVLDALYSGNDHREKD